MQIFVREVALMFGKDVKIDWQHAALILCLIGRIEAHPEEFGTAELVLCREVGKDLTLEMTRVFFDEE